MTWLWIGGGLLAALALLSRLRVGIRASFGAAARVSVTVGPLRLGLYPAKKGRAKAEQAPKAKEKPAKPAKKQRARPLPKPGLADVKSAVRALAPAFKKALGRTRRSVRLDPLDLSVTIGGAKAPAAAAEACGWAHGAVWTVMPALEQLLVIPNPRIHIGLDFEAAAAKAEGELGLSIRLGTVIAAGFGIGFPALRWFLQYQKEASRRQPPAPQAPAPTADTAA